MKPQENRGMRLWKNVRHSPTNCYTAVPLSASPRAWERVGNHRDNRLHLKDRCYLEWDFWSTSSSSYLSGDDNDNYNINKKKEISIMIMYSQYACLYVCKYLWMYACMCLYVYMYVCMFVNMHVCVCMYLGVCVYAFHSLWAQIAKWPSIVKVNDQNLWNLSTK